MVPGLQAADDPHFYYLDNTGTLLLGPCGPGGGPYGRREHGRFRRSAGRNPRDGKGVNLAFRDMLSNVTQNASEVFMMSLVTFGSLTLSSCCDDLRMPIDSLFQIS